MRKVRIDRAKWRTGSSGIGSTELLNKEGFMCCLGFACNQLSRVPLKDLLGKGTPGGVSNSRKRGVKGLSFIFRRGLGDDKSYIGYSDTQFSNDCIYINDTTRLTSRQREAKLKSRFKKEGIELEFYGRY